MLLHITPLPFPPFHPLRVRLLNIQGSESALFLPVHSSLLRIPRKLIGWKVLSLVYFPVAFLVTLPSGMVGSKVLRLYSCYSP